ncbi:MAG: TetR/AcrR family transcriptional regulator [Actinobacteria bacterium]|nr:TetR/AcrR family transcriptional regulator [Actinomycetota bacterium]
MNKRSGTIFPPVPDPPSALRSAAAERRATILGLVACAGRENCDADSTRGRVLEAAVGMFAEKGFGSCTMRELAAAAGVKAPALYNHFSSKEEILAEAMDLVLADFYSWVLEPLQDEPPERWLELIVRQHTVYQLEHVVLAKANQLLMESEALSRHLPEQEYTRMRATQREYVRLIRDLVGAASEIATEEQTTIASYSVVAMCNWVKTWYRRDGDLTPSEVVDYVWRLVVKMLSQG